MRIAQRSIWSFAAVAGGIACSSSSATGPAEGGLDGEAQMDASSQDSSEGDADGATGSCNQDSDCPPIGGGACASMCSDGTNPCARACVDHACAPRGCPDASVPDAEAGATNVGVDAGDAGGASDAGCAGTAPNCFGNDAQTCCGQDPSGRASCVAGAWRCGTAPAPGCNGTSCLALDGSTD
jgi:hypothetical protein